MKRNLGTAVILALLLVLGNGCIPIMALMLPVMHGFEGHGNHGEKSSTSAESATHEGEQMAGVHGGSDVHGTSPGEAGHEHGADDPEGTVDYPTPPQDGDEMVDTPTHQNH